MQKLISNCVLGYQCNLTWGELTSTDNPAIRHCEKCRHDVHYCATPKELMAATKRKYCVAIDVVDDNGTHRLLGEPIILSNPEFE